MKRRDSKLNTKCKHDWRSVYVTFLLSRLTKEIQKVRDQLALERREVEEVKATYRRKEEALNAT